MYVCIVGVVGALPSFC